LHVKVISAFCLSAGRDVYDGEVLEVDDLNARRLIGMGFVVAVEAAPAPSPASAPEVEVFAADVMLNREPEPENREPL
jgi:hypothetical protein